MCYTRTITHKKCLHTAFDKQRCEEKKLTEKKLPQVSAPGRQRLTEACRVQKGFKKEGRNTSCERCMEKRKVPTEEERDLLKEAEAKEREG